MVGEGRRRRREREEGRGGRRGEDGEEKENRAEDDRAKGKQVKVYDQNA